jgi:hypothetical protein
MPTGQLVPRLIFAVGLLVAAVAVGFVLARPSEIPLAALRTKYSSPASRFVRLADGAHVHVRDEGSGPLLLLLPGLHSPLQVWEPWVTRLHDSLRLVSIDLPGQGLSDAWPRDDYSVAALGSLITEVTSALRM